MLPLRELASPLRKRVILLALKRAGLSQDISAVHLDAAEKMVLEGSVSRQIEFPGGYGLKMGYEKAEILTPLSQLSAADSPAKGGVGILMKRVSRDAYEKFLAASSSPGDKALRVMISAEELDVDALEIRTRQPGDFIRPFGMKGRKSLQNYLVDRKVSQELRDRLPLVCFGQEVIWIPGVGVSEICRITEATENILSLEYFD